MFPSYSQSNFDDVGRFHTKFGLPISMSQPREVTEELLLFRIKFMVEEVFEFIMAAGYEITSIENNKPILTRVTDKVDHAGMFDALIDEVYVALGTAHLLGYPWQAGWDLVQRANMAKVRAAQDSDSERGGSWDVIKPPGWVAPDIAGLLLEGNWNIEDEL